MSPAEVIPPKAFVDFKCSIYPTTQQAQKAGPGVTAVGPPRRWLGAARLKIDRLSSSRPLGGQGSQFLPEEGFILPGVLEVLIALWISLEQPITFHVVVVGVFQPAEEVLVFAWDTVSVFFSGHQGFPRASRRLGGGAE